MKVAIIINGISRKKRRFYNSIFPGLQKKFNADVFETQHAQHAVTLASEAVEKQFDYVVAAGGDGTVNQVVNGILKGREHEEKLPTVGVIPLGTGNDFAGLCKIQPTASSIERLLALNEPRKTDVGKISCCDEHGNSVVSYFINVCSLGMGPEVVKRLYTSKRLLGPSLTYFKSIAATFFSHKPQEVFVKGDGWQHMGKVRVVAIANGKSFGHSLYVAPDAEPDDGVFSTFIAGDLPLWKFLLFLQTIKTGRKINDRYIAYNKSTFIELTAPQPCPIEAEGEWMGWLPAKIDMLPGRLQVLR